MKSAFLMHRAGVLPMVNGVDLQYAKHSRLRAEGRRRPRPQGKLP